MGMENFLFPFTNVSVNLYNNKIVVTLINNKYAIGCH